MDLFREIDAFQEVEETLENGVDDDIRDVPTLRRIMHDALQALEQSLTKLPPRERMTAYSHYLRKVRKLTFSFHMAVVGLTGLRNEGRRESPPETVEALIDWYGRERLRLRDLYRYL